MQLHLASFGFKMHGLAVTQRRPRGYNVRCCAATDGANARSGSTSEGSAGRAMQLYEAQTWITMRLNDKGDKGYVN